MRGLPASELRTDDVAQMAYATESTPQSTINHNAVIELASDLQRMSPRHGRDPRKGAQKAGLLANRGPKSAGTMPKSHPQGNAAGGKISRFRKVFAATQNFHGTPRYGCWRCGTAAAPCLIDPETAAPRPRRRSRRSRRRAPRPDRLLSQIP